MIAVSRTPIHSAIRVLGSINDIQQYLSISINVFTVLLLDKYCNHCSYSMYIVYYIDCSVMV